MEVKFTRCEPADPNRCQGVFKQGQCPYLAHPGSKNCIMHGGNNAAQQQNTKNIHDFKLAVWEDRVNAFAGSSQVKNLRGEIGITRLTLESVLNLIKEPAHFPIYVDKISSLVSQIEKLVVSAQKMEERNNELLDKNQVFLIADIVINILSLYIEDPDKLLEASDAFHEQITNFVCGSGQAGSAA